MITFQSFVFYLFAAVLIAAALGVITARNPVHCALYLVLAFFTAAAEWLLLEAEFLAIALVLVYVGAVMVLFLFVVMMLDINLDRLREGFWKYLPVGAAVGIAMVVEMAVVLVKPAFSLLPGPAPLPGVAKYSNTEAIGKLLYTQYVYPFELAAVILLVAIVAAIALTMRRRKDTKYQNPSVQVRAKAKDRVRIVSMPSEKPASPAAPEKTEA